MLSHYNTRRNIATIAGNIGTCAYAAAYVAKRTVL